MTAESIQKILGYKDKLVQVEDRLRAAINGDGFDHLTVYWLEATADEIKTMSEQMNFLPQFCEINARRMWFYELDAVAAMLLFISACKPYALGRLDENARAHRAIKTTDAMLEDIIWGLKHYAISGTDERKEES